MSDERAPTETPKAAAAFHEYCLLGRDRSLAKLAQKWGKSGAYVGQLERWSSQHHWVKRVAEYDEAFAKAQAKAEEEAVIAERKKILSSRYALMHKRLEVLDSLAQKLIDMTEDEDKVWVADVKSVGTGPTAERVDLVRFNAELFAQIRGYFADIAAEMGERVKKTDTTLNLPPNIYIGFNPDEDGSVE